MTECPHVRTRVLETRTVEGRVYRRRQCRDCQRRFVTVETRDGEQPASSIPRPRTDAERELDAERARLRRGVKRKLTARPREDVGAHLQSIWR